MSCIEEKEVGRKALLLFSMSFPAAEATLVETISPTPSLPTAPKTNRFVPFLPPKDFDHVGGRCRRWLSAERQVFFFSPSFQSRIPPSPPSYTCCPGLPLPHTILLFSTKNVVVNSPACSPCPVHILPPFPQGSVALSLSPFFLLRFSRVHDSKRTSSSFPTPNIVGGQNIFDGTATIANSSAEKDGKRPCSAQFVRLSFLLRPPSPLSRLHFRRPSSLYTIFPIFGGAHFPPLLPSAFTTQLLFYTFTPHRPRGRKIQSFRLSGNFKNYLVSCLNK